MNESNKNSSKDNLTKRSFNGGKNGNAKGKSTGNYKGKNNSK
jgi:hypothetical protein